MLWNQNPATLPAAFLTALAFARPALAQEFDLSWHTIDGGGQMICLGGVFELGGTIGQPDAGQSMIGGSFELVGGFWPAVTVAPPSCPGDLDGNRAVDLADLTTLLSNFGTPGGATPEQGDLDGDGRIDLTDLTLILSAFGTICP